MLVHHQPAPDNFVPLHSVIIVQGNPAVAVVIGEGWFRFELRTHNEAARIFYECLGFDQLGVVQGYYQGREAALRMSRRLAKNQC